MKTRSRAGAPFRALAKYFLRGLIVVAPVAVTVIAVRWTFAEIDTWINVEPLLNRKLPGAGVVLTVLAITVVGFLASNFATRWLFLAMGALQGEHRYRGYALSFSLMNLPRPVIFPISNPRHSSPCSAWRRKRWSTCSNVVARNTSNW